jgi:hypothetical protein
VKKTFLKIKALYDNFQIYAKSEPHTLKKALIIFSALIPIVLFVFFPPLALVFWGVFSAPWLFIIASLLLFAISYGYIIKGISLDTGSRIKNWKIAKSLFIVNFIFWFCTLGVCAVCFVAGLVGIRMVSSQIQFPIADVWTIDVDSNGQVYCFDALYSRLQLFDNDGRFVRGWFVAPKAKFASFGLYVDENDRPCIFQNEKKYIYTSEGQLISVTQTQPISDRESYADYSKSTAQDNSGNIYTSVESFFSPWKLIKSNGENESVLISEPIGLWFVGPLFPMLAFIILSLFSLFILFARKN